MPKKIFFKKKSKKPYFKAIFGLCLQNFGKNEFSWKKGFYQFLNILMIYHVAKTLKK